MTSPRPDKFLIWMWSKRDGRFLFVVFGKVSKNKNIIPKKNHTIFGNEMKIFQREWNDLNHRFRIFA